jgi:enoyl-CoA hydratase
MSMQYKHLLVEVNDSIGMVTVNRPEVRNAMNPETVQEIYQVMKDFAANDEVKVVIFTGAGNKSFVSGADINKLKERTYLDALQPGMQGLNQQIEQFDKPVIAAVNGFALGGGCELAMACDVRIAAEHAKFGLPELNLGIIPGAGGTQRLTRLVGRGKAKELILTGDIIPAREAERIGLVNKVVAIDQLLSTAIEMAQKMITKGPLALYLAKKAIDAGSDAPLHVGMMVEKLSQAVLMSTEDKVEGTSAFLEKRPPRFRGR